MDRVGLTNEDGFERERVCLGHGSIFIKVQKSEQNPLQKREFRGLSSAA